MHHISAKFIVINVKLYTDMLKILFQDFLVNCAPAIIEIGRCIIGDLHRERKRAWLGKIFLSIFLLSQRLEGKLPVCPWLIFQ